MVKRPKPVVLCILDGWGHRADTQDNAISVAKTPCMDHLVRHYPNALLKTSGLDVGLPDEQMGNSEVGHMNIGSGRVVMQDLPRIDEAIKQKAIESNKWFKELVATLKKQQSRCHLLGLLSDGGVHSHQDHMLALAHLLAKQGIYVYIHAFLDGRDTPPNSAKNYITWCEESIASEPLIRIATVAGRYYAMDRDKRWDRVKLAYDAMCLGKGEQAGSAMKAVEMSYASGKQDEFVLPTVIDAEGIIRDGDAILMTNFRADRAREILQALVDPDFNDFKRDHVPSLSQALGLVEYSSKLNMFMKSMFEPFELNHILGEIIADQGLSQLRIAETEKYAHVTFFFNGGREEPFEKEERIMIPSPDVATYDLKPQMSAFELTDKLVDAIESNRFDLIVVNYANTDMVGHTGDMQAAIAAVEAVDHCLERLSKAVLAQHGVLLISADHGNAEQMHDDHTGQSHTAHTTGPVPIIVVGDVVKHRKIKDGRLCDIAPTILELMQLPKPSVMTGASLLV